MYFGLPDKYNCIWSGYSWSVNHRYIFIKYYYSLKIVQNYKWILSKYKYIQIWIDDLKKKSLIIYKEQRINIFI